MMQCWTADSQGTYQLKDSCGSGGEGTTYQVDGHLELVAKIYNAENLERHFPGASGENEWTMREKIFYMISARSNLHLTVSQFGDSIDAVAWPTEALFDSRSYFIGFLMPKVEFAVSDDLGITDLHCAYRQWERQRLFGERYSWLTAIKIATNLAAVVQCLHENDIVIGDFNCNNILIDGQGHVTLIDADSLCIHNRQRGITYRCIVGVGEFLAPELQGIALDDTRSRRSFTEESDCFSLAIHIFMLLMGGVHPFSGAKTGDVRRASSSMEPYARSIANGECPYVTGSTLTPFADTPKMLHLPYYIREMFDRAFGYANPDGKIPEEAIARRPTAKEWHDALKRLYDECASSPMVCPRDDSHVNLPKNDTCMWCEAEGVLTPLEDARNRKPLEKEPEPSSEPDIEETQDTPARQKVPPEPEPKTRPVSDTAATGQHDEPKYQKGKRAVIALFCVFMGIALLYTLGTGGNNHNGGNSPSSSVTTGVPANSTLTSAEQGNAEAQYELGEAYFMGTGEMAQDYQEAIKWYREAAAQGYAPAQDALGYCYYIGAGVEKDDVRAAEWLRKAADQEYAPAQYKLATFYEMGLGVGQDDEQAAELYAKSIPGLQQAAEQGDQLAQVYLAQCYEYGDGIEENQEQAVHWYQQAAEQGSPTAQCKLGQHYYSGQGVEQSNETAIEWWRKAAEQGDEDAQERLEILDAA